MQEQTGLQGEQFVRTQMLLGAEGMEKLKKARPKIRRFLAFDGDLGYNYF